MNNTRERFFEFRNSPRFESSWPGGMGDCLSSLSSRSRASRSSWLSYVLMSVAGVVTAWLPNPTRSTPHQRGNRALPLEGDDPSPEPEPALHQIVSECSCRFFKGHDANRLDPVVLADVFSQRVRRRPPLHRVGARRGERPIHRVLARRVRGRAYRVPRNRRELLTALFVETRPQPWWQ